MDLGSKIKAARLEMGLSQRQLCGDTITRNMLSQIENGTARPSMDTLSVLAHRLGKTVSYFLEEQAVVSPNGEVMARARRAWEEEDYTAVVEALEGFREPDSVYQQEKALLLYMGYLGMARQALQEKRRPYACTLLKKADGVTGLYITPALRQEAQLLLAKAGEAVQLESMDDALLVRAEQALRRQDYGRAMALLRAAEDTRAAQWQYLQAEALYGMADYGAAAACYERLEEDETIISRLEACFRELGDYKKAYEYAVKRRT